MNPFRGQRLYARRRTDLEAIINNARRENPGQNQNNSNTDNEDDIIIIDDSDSDNAVDYDLGNSLENQYLRRRIDALVSERNRIQTELQTMVSTLDNQRPHINNSVGNVLQCSVCLEKRDVNGPIGFHIGYSTLLRRTFSMNKPVCGHILCGSCSTKMSGRCHICRMQIQGYQRIYFN